MSRSVWENLSTMALALFLALVVWVVAINEENPALEKRESVDSSRLPLGRPKTSGPLILLLLSYHTPRKPQLAAPSRSRPDTQRSSANSVYDSSRLASLGESAIIQWTTPGDEQHRPRKFTPIIRPQAGPGNASKNAASRTGSRRASRFELPSRAIAKS